MRATIAGVVCVVLALTGASITSAAVKPVLRVGPGKAVEGSRFKAHEVIRVVFISGVRKVRVVRASAAGSFAASVPSLTGSCAPLQIRATGSSGGVATIALSRGLCAPASASGTHGADSQAPQTGTLPTPNGSATVEGGDSQAPQTGTLPDQHGPPTVNPGPV
jgi:hypothetical protein